MSKPKTIGPALTDLALAILDRVKGEEVPLEIQLDAFKALTAFHVGATRVAKNVPEEPAESSIGVLKDRIAFATVGRRAADPDKIQRDPERVRKWKQAQLPDATNDVTKFHPNREP